MATGNVLKQAYAFHTSAATHVSAPHPASGVSGRPGNAIADATASWHKPPVGKAELYARISIGPCLTAEM